MAVVHHVSFSAYKQLLSQLDPLEYGGRVSQVVGLTVESNGPATNVGDICHIFTHKRDKYIQAEVVGFRDKQVLLMPFSELSGVGPGNRVISTNKSFMVPVGRGFQGRILDGLGTPIDNKGAVRPDAYYPIDNDPPNPLSRTRIKEALPMGVKAIDSMLAIGRGQRIGIFAGSGVGKSTLLGMIARNALADINVITLVGERGREVNDFIEKDLKEEGLRRSILIIATSDQPALIRLKSAMVGTAMAEYFRDQGFNVLLLMDSLTRFAMAQREIGMAVGEPPVSRGYTPSVYAKLPRLLERTGTSDRGSITGLYTVLVEGDDMNEPVADTVRGILDGHMVLSRSLANSNHYPAIDVLASVSRVMPDIVEQRQLKYAGFIRNMMATYREAQDLINIGAYQKGSNPNIDQAIELIDQINKLLCQDINETTPYEQILPAMEAIAGSRVQL